MNSTHSRLRTDGGEDLPDPSPGWYAIHEPHQDPAKVISGPHETPEGASRAASMPAGNSAVMHTPALVNAVKHEDYNVEWLDGADKPDSLQDPEVETDGGHPAGDEPPYPAGKDLSPDIPHELAEITVKIFQTKDGPLVGVSNGGGLSTPLDADEARETAGALLRAAHLVDSPDRQPVDDPVEAVEWLNWSAKNLATSGESTLDAAHEIAFTGRPILPARRYRDGIMDTLDLAGMALQHLTESRQLLETATEEGGESGEVMTGTGLDTPLSPGAKAADEGGDDGDE